jgi:hypothetical protein
MGMISTLFLGVEASAAKAVKATKLTVSPTSLVITKGSTKTVKVTFSPANTSNKTLKWTTSNKKYVTVSSKGVVTGVAVGNATVTVTNPSSKLSKKIAVSVIPKVVEDLGWKKTLDAFTVAMKSADVLALTKLVDPSQTSILEDAITADDPPAALDLYKEYAAESMIEIVSTTTDVKNKVTVRLNVTNKYAADVMLEALKATIQESFKVMLQSGKELSDDEMNAIYADKLQEAIQNAGPLEDVTTELVLVIEKVNGKWIITGLDDQVANVLTLGFYDVLGGL